MASSRAQHKAASSDPGPTGTAGARGRRQEAAPSSRRVATDADGRLIISEIARQQEQHAPYRSRRPSSQR